MAAHTAFDLGAQFEALGAAQTVASDTANHIEGELRVALPDEFGRVCEFLDGTPLTMVDGQQAHGQSYAQCVVSMTVACRRELGLPSQYVVLAEEEEFVLLLACDGASLGGGRVHLMPRAELSLFSSGVEPSTSRNWPSFVEYFSDALQGDQRGAGR